METEQCIDTRFEDYFTLKDHSTAMCNFCRNDYVIDLNFEEVQHHLLKIHQILYEVSSSVVNKNLVSQHYQILNNKFICKYCETNNFLFSYNKKNTLAHLRNKHKICMYTANKIRELLKEEFDCYAEKYFCKRCTSSNEKTTNALPNKPYLLMKHLLENHGIDMSTKKQIEQTGFSILLPLSIETYLEEGYFKKFENTAICKICTKNVTSYSINDHKKNIPVLYLRKIMKLHLAENHKLNRNVTIKLKNLISEKFHLTIFGTSKCKICNIIIPGTSMLELMIHLREKHNNEVMIPPEFKSITVMDTSISSLYDTDKSVTNNAFSSNYQKSASSSFDNVNTSSSSKRRITESCHLPIPGLYDSIPKQYIPSSNYQQIADSRFYYVNTSSSFEQEATGVMDTSISGLYDTDKFDTNNSSSSNYQQSDSFSFDNVNTSSSSERKATESCNLSIPGLYDSIPKQYIPSSNYQQTADSRFYYVNTSSSFEQEATGLCKLSIPGLYDSIPRQHISFSNYQQSAISFSCNANSSLSSKSEATRNPEDISLSRNKKPPLQQLTQRYDQCFDSDNLNN